VINTFLAAAEGESPEKNLVSEHSSTLVNSMLKNSRIGELSTTVKSSTKGSSTLLITFDSESPYLGVALSSSPAGYRPI